MTHEEIVDLDELIADAEDTFGGLGADEVIEYIKTQVPYGTNYEVAMEIAALGIVAARKFAVENAS